MSIAINRRAAGEQGIALVTTMLILMLMSALLIGLTTVVQSDQRYRSIDRDRYRAFYAANSGLEKLTADLGNLFFRNVAPTDAQIGALSTGVPTIPGVAFVQSGDAAYGVALRGTGSGTITTGPYQGLIALKKTYELNSSVATLAGGEAHLKRTIETVAIPVFQFGMFSEVDLSFSAADDFDFGGRIHTNGNLFLAQGGSSGSTLWLRDKVTAVKDIIRQRLSNGVSIDTSGSTLPVKVATAPGSYRSLARSEGSLIDGVGSSANPNWSTISLSTYNGYLRTGKTGAKALNLPLTMQSVGGSNLDLIRRPVIDENVSNPTLLGERYFSKVSLRILLSDRAQDLTDLPGATATPPVLLDGNWLAAPPNNGTAYGPIDAAHPPVAASPGLQRWVVTGGSVTAGTLRVIRTSSGIPFRFQTPTLTLTAGANSYAVTCGGKTAAQFFACTSHTGALAVAVSATVDGVRVSTTGTWNGTVIDVGSTMAFAPNTFWEEDSATLITCSGYDTTLSPQRFTECNVPRSIAANAVLTTHLRSDAGVGLLGGYLKIERQDPSGVWHDVTMEILNWGIGAANQDGRTCADPTPNAILRLQRLRDNSETNAMAPAGSGCSYAGSTKPTDYWPNVLFDAREAVFRDANPGASNLRLGGVMHYVALDVANLSRWFAATGVYGSGTGANSISDNGFSVYFSDRRNNRNDAGEETGEYGFEDVVNPMSASGTPNGTLDAGEDFNGDGRLQVYGQYPSYNASTRTVPPCGDPACNNGVYNNMNASARPTTEISAGMAAVNRPILFRRALKLVDAASPNIAVPGLTIASENPVYVKGDFNANAALGWNASHVAASIVTDAITMLSNNWNDRDSLASPYDTGGRARGANTWYRVAVIAGKGPIFPRPGNGEGATFGTDGGAHSFLRFLEGGGGTIHYRGSLVTFFYDRQAVSPFKCCGGIVYDVPTRDYTFDVDFLDPAKLPPLTPVFRDLNALGFRQENRPGR